VEDESTSAQGVAVRRSVKRQARFLPSNRGELLAVIEAARPLIEDDPDGERVGRGVSGSGPGIAGGALQSAKRNAIILRDCVLG
jgi:hypothetical protein